MATSSFKTNPIRLEELLRECHRGVLQLPDFQRSWVWDEDRIRSLIASISRGFPVGAIMTLDSGGEVQFKPRPVEGAPLAAVEQPPKSLLLDGQQRLTSLYQVSIRNQVVQTITSRNKRVKRWYYFDMRMAIDSDLDREESIVGVPEDRILKSDFARTIDLDLSTQQLEFDHMMFPISQIFDADDWLSSFMEDGIGREDQTERWQIRKQFKRDIVDTFEQYHVPAIALDSDTSKEAVCVVFEKVNTGGKPLDAFELITAIYAAEGYELRKDWYGDSAHSGREGRFRELLKSGETQSGILSGVGNTDFLHVVSLFHTRDRRKLAESQGRTGKELPQISGNRAALLDLPLDAYKKYQEIAETGFIRAEKFLHSIHVYRVFDLPYQSQLIPLAAILADLGSKWDWETYRSKIERWYWCGVFGELYGSTTETRIARDFVEVPEWLDGGAEPTTVQDAVFQGSRLGTMRMRLSAAYKGVNALLMKKGARDFRSGQHFALSVFFDENVDIHHIFPQAWCNASGIDQNLCDSIINKSPLAAQTNRIIGGVAPSAYIARLERGFEGHSGPSRETLDEILESHLIEPELIRADNFAGFFEARRTSLLKLIESAMGKAVFADSGTDQAEDHSATDEAELTLAAAD